MHSVKIVEFGDALCINELPTVQYTSIIVFIIFQKYFTKGITMGAVKG